MYVTERICNGMSDSDKTKQSDVDNIQADEQKQTESSNKPISDDMEEAIAYAKKYLEDILSFFGLNIDIYATTEDHEVIELSVPSSHMNGFLIGQRGETMRALQYMVSNALKNQNFGRNRVNVDVAEYKKNRADQLADKAQIWISKVKESGEPMALRPMNAADRRTVHKTASDAGLQTESQGEGRDRHIVLKPGDAAPDKPTEEPTEE